MTSNYLKIQKLYHLIIDNYVDNTIAEGWHIRYMRTLSEFSFIVVSSRTVIGITLNEICEKAKLHGIICNRDGEIIDVNEEQFNNTLYLWQAQDLGIL